MFEHAALPPVPLRTFLLRLLRHAGYATSLIFVSLVMGVVGFMWLAAETPIDALLNAAMLLGGMGPVGDLSHASTAGKLFAALYALYAGLVFVVVAGVLLTPVFHRILHHFHWELGRGAASHGTKP